MTRRYGRNQKRKHRERIAELEQTTISLTDEIKSLFRENYNYKTELEQIIKEFAIWWNNSVIGDPEFYKIRDKLPPAFQQDIKEPMPSAAMFDPNSVNYHKIKDQMLYALEITVRENIGERHMHIILSGVGKEVGYYLDPRTLLTFKGFPSHAIKYTTKKIMQELTAYMKKYYEKINYKKEII